MVRRLLVALPGVAILTASLLGQEPARFQPKLAGEFTPRVSEEMAKGPVPRLPDGKPDLSGPWVGGGSNDDIEHEGGLKPGELPLLPAAKALRDSRNEKDEPYLWCTPMSVPRKNPFPWRFVHSYTAKGPGHIFVIHENGDGGANRQIFMDGRKHPADPDPTWYGHSIGRFEGNTLVVDTVGFNDKFWFDFKGHPHTERLHIVERYTRKDYNTLVNQITIDDPGAYSRPFTVTFTAELAPPGDELMEYICQENNQDVEHLQGPTQPGGDPDRPLGTLKTR
jgi:hypothetical protein